MQPDDKDFDAKLQERFAQLPKVVQDAITSAGIESHMRELSEHHNLHLDQWELLENEVMLALLGFQPAENLAENIQKQVGLDEATSIQLAADISTIVFAPIRQELERQLEHPDAVVKQTTGVEDMRTQMLADAAPGNVPPVPAPTPETVPSGNMPSPVTATPTGPITPAAPAPAPAQKVERAAIPAAYTSTPSHERKAIEGDPYREQLS